jgi:hypothetical protein
MSGPWVFGMVLGDQNPMDWTVVESHPCAQNRMGHLAPSLTNFRVQFYWGALHYNPKRRYYVTAAELSTRLSVGVANREILKS